MYLCAKIPNEDYKKGIFYSPTRKHTNIDDLSLATSLAHELMNVYIGAAAANVDKLEFEQQLGLIILPDSQDTGLFILIE